MLRFGQTEARWQGENNRIERDDVVLKREIHSSAVVIGAGLSGICAAIALSRENVKTVLIQDRPVLGGNSGPEISVPIGGADHIGAYRHSRETGILDELLLENAYFPNFSNPATSQGFSGSIWDLVLRTAIWKEKNITLLMNTIAKNPVVEGGRIISVVGEQNSTETEYLIYGDIFLDCSGDSRVAVEAGAKFMHGQEGSKEYAEDLAPVAPDGKTMGNSVYIRAKDVGKPTPFHAPSWAYTYQHDDDFPGGWPDCPHDVRLLTGYPGGYWWIEFGGEYHTIHDSEFIHQELMRYAVGVWDHIKNYGDHGAENYVLDWISITPGKRESRRLIGDVLLKQRDLEELTVFADAVAYGGWNIDVHYPPGISGKNGKYWHGKDLHGLYTIPLSALYSVNLENLLFAGRNLSATHVAMGSARVMATCALMGQAIGNAAAVCVKRCVTPREVRRLHIAEVQQNLLRQDVYLPGFALDRESNLACQAKIKASSQASLRFPEPDRFIDAEKALAQSFFADAVDTFALLLQNTSDQPVTAEVGLYLGAGVNNLVSRALVLTARAVVPPGRYWVEFPAGCKWDHMRCVQLALAPNPCLQWGYSQIEPPATTAGREHQDGFLRRGRGTFCVRLTPESFCYGPEQALTGVNRPDAQPNLWMTEAGFPQTMYLQWSNPVVFTEIRLTFDDNLDRPLRRITDYRIAPELIKDYEVQAMVNGRWITLVSEVDNHLRHRIHRFERILASELKLVLLSANGCDSARLVELQIFNEQANEE